MYIDRPRTMKFSDRNYFVENNYLGSIRSEIYHLCCIGMSIAGGISILRVSMSLKIEGIPISVSLVVEFIFDNIKLMNLSRGHHPLNRYT